MTSRIYVFLGLVLLLPGVAQAAVIYSDLNPADDSYALNSGQGVAGSGTAFGRELSIAVPIMLSNDAVLGTIELALEAVPPGFGAPTDAMRVSVWGDTAGLPGTLVDDLGVMSGFPAEDSSNSILQSYVSTAMPQLLANTQYWVKVSAATADAWASWKYNTQGVLGDAYFDGGVGVWQARASAPAGAMRILSVDATVFVPGSFVLMVLGIGVLRLR